jgi:hypothetical protein
MNKPTIDEILAPKPEARPRIYAYSINDAAHKGLLKVGQTTRDVKRRIAEQLKTAAIKNYIIELDESAERVDGTIFTDHHVRTALVKKKFENTELEWMRCSVTDVKTVLTELRTGQRFTGTHHESFAMRREQAEAVNKTHAYFHSIWKEDSGYILNYVRKKNIAALVKKLRKEMDDKLPFQQSGTCTDHKLKWSFSSLHDHSSGEQVKVLHIGLNVFAN